MKKSGFTNKEMMELPEGSLVRIKKEFTDDPIFLKGGRLIFQSRGMMEHDERPFGISFEDAISSFCFSCNAYELIDAIIPLTAEERKAVDAILVRDPKWKKAEKEENANQELNWFCEINPEVSFKRLAPHQFRVEMGDRKIDVFPQSKKYHDINNNQRGVYKDMTELLMLHFNIPQRGL